MMFFRYDGVDHKVHRRDSQRSKAYAAEREAFGWPAKDVLTWAEVEAFAASVLNSATWKTQQKRTGPWWFRGRVRVTKVRSNNGHSYGGLIALPSKGCSKRLVLHELAHEVAPPWVQHHWPWASAYLALVSRFLGVEAAARLRDAFRRHGVRYRAPVKRELTQEQRWAIRDRLAAGRLRHKMAIAGDNVEAAPATTSP